jgi:hypothetical protein
MYAIEKIKTNAIAIFTTMDEAAKKRYQKLGYKIYNLSNKKDATYIQEKYGH